MIAATVRTARCTPDATPRCIASPRQRCCIEADPALGCCCRSLPLIAHCDSELTVGDDARTSSGAGAGRRGFETLASRGGCRYDAGAESDRCPLEPQARQVAGSVDVERPPRAWRGEFADGGPNSSELSRATGGMSPTTSSRRGRWARAGARHVRPPAAAPTLAYSALHEANVPLLSAALSSFRPPRVSPSTIIWGKLVSPVTPTSSASSSGCSARSTSSKATPRFESSDFAWTQKVQEPVEKRMTRLGTSTSI